MNQKCFLLIVALLVFWMNQIVFSFTVILKSGKVVEGTWLDENSSHIRIKDKDGTVLSFSKSTLDLRAMGSASRILPPTAKNGKAAVSETALTLPSSGYQMSEDQPSPNVDEMKPAPTTPASSQRVLNPDHPVSPTTSPAPAEAIPSGRLWSPYLVLSNVYDSNINHDEVDVIDSVGVIFGAGVRWQNRVNKPTIEISYGIAKHSYSRTDQWDRISHNLKASHEWRFQKNFSLETDSEISIKGATEDRELGNQYLLKPRLKYKITSSNRAEVYIAGRLKRYDETDRNAVNTYYGASFEHRFGNHRVEFGYRRERNQAEGPRNDWVRWIYSIDYTVPFARRDWLSVEVQHKPQHYFSRLVDIDVDHGPDLEFLRRDKRWLFTVEAAIALNQHLYIFPGYTYEKRTSNDPEKHFDAHLPVLALKYFW